uniref:Hypotheticial protein n=1 Tax=Schistosoma japonicum TaxID=6182 RepID=C1L9M6_SCHJA|nr:hypotheticial protein [Schistosoma japonicum]CAX71402.1 hypotheticial protein [Schistosoma japonicum]CAX71404.1 hypotheticial protein [Schistosoma japonicum]CAX71405.1 hypotheticial protein [Schistosoma japonicum]
MGLTRLMFFYVAQMIAMTVFSEFCSIVYAGPGDDVEPWGFYRR